MTEDFKSAIKNKKIPIIWILGGPGSGKGTLCEKIVATFGFTHVSTGDLLRDEVQKGSERGQELTKIMKEGQLVPMETVLTLLAEKMQKELPNSKGFLVDGYPREKEQGIKFEACIAPVDIVIYLKAEDDLMMERCLHRAETSGRSDDNVETIKKRLQTFHQNNDPVLQQYENKTKTISARQTPEEIMAQVKAIIDPLLSA